MNRREFNAGLVAATAAPNVPIKAAAALPTSTPVGATAGGNFTAYAYTCARQFAQRAGQASPEILAKEFGLTASSARAITSRLIHKGVLLAPNAIGVSRAADAIVKTTPKAAIATSSPKSEVPEKLVKLAKQALSEDSEPDEPLIEHPDEA